jgi:hypothetical protein
MRINSKVSFLVVFTPLIFLLNSCCLNSNCTDVEIGKGTIKDTSLLWIPYQQNDTIAFANSKGFAAKFVTEGFKDLSDKALHKEYSANCGDPQTPCYEYYTLPVKRITFHSEKINLKFSFEIRKNLKASNYLYPVMNPDTIGDILVVQINNDRRTIALTNNYTDIVNEVEFLGSVVLNGKVFHSVYHSYINYSGFEIKLDGIYYTKSEGLVGFYLTNGEQWFIN